MVGEQADSWWEGGEGWRDEEKEKGLMTWQWCGDCGGEGVQGG